MEGLLQGRLAEDRVGCLARAFRFHSLRLTHRLHEILDPSQLTQLFSS